MNIGLSVSVKEFRAFGVGFRTKDLASKVWRLGFRV